MTNHNRRPRNGGKVGAGGRVVTAVNGSVVVWSPERWLKKECEELRCPLLRIRVRDRAGNSVKW